MHKEDRQANGGLTSLGVTNEARANPQLSSGMSAFILNKPIYSASFIIHSESASGIDASAISTAKVDPGKSAPSTDPHVLANKTQSVSEGLETVITKPTTRKWASSIARQVKEDEASRTIKLEDLAKLVSSVQPSFRDLDSPKDDPIIVVDDSDEDEKADKVHAITNVETEDTLIHKSSSLMSSQIQELTNQVLILQSQKHKLELEKNKAEAEAALLKAQPSFPNVGQLNELLVKSLQTEFSNILSAHDFSSSLPTKLKDLPSKFNELTKKVKGLKKQVHELEIELLEGLKEIPTKLEDFTKTVTSLTSQVAELKTLQWELPAEFLSLPVQVASVQAKLKILDTLPSLLLNVTKALNTFAQVLDYASSKFRDQSVPSAGQADTMPAEGEQNTNQTTISQLFQRRTKNNVEKENLTKQQSKPTPAPTTPIIPPVITTTTIQMQSPFLHIPPKSSSQPEGGHTMKDKGKKAVSSEEDVKESTDSDYDDDETYVSRTNQSTKEIEEEAKAKAARHESELRKEEFVDLLGPEGPITLKVYKEDGTSEIIPNFKASDLYLSEWREVMNACPNRTGKQDPLDKLNDLANKKRKHADDIHDYFKANKRLKQDFVTIEDLKDFSNTMLYTIQEIFFRRHQGPRLDDHAMAFSSFLLAEVDKRNLNPLKQMRTIEQLRQ
ncbi:hypothetical protein Tco_1272511 [Tanacetum coccineum]